MESTEPSSSGAVVSTAAIQVGGVLETQVARHAHRATLPELLALGPGQVPAARDRFVGVPVLLSPSGHLYVIRSHSHAALARTVLVDAGVPFDADHPDRTLGAVHGWVMIQAAGAEGVKIQIDRAPTARQREVLDDLVLYEGFARRRVALHWGRPMTWSRDSMAWEANPAFVAASDADAIRRLLRGRAPAPLSR